MASGLKQQVHVPPAAVDLGIVLLLLFLRVYASWMEWVDLVVDFGRELYVPWRITQGAALYRDMAWFSGPFSAYFNAMVYSIGGVSVTSIVVANVIACATAATLLYFILREVASRLAALTGGCVFVFLFSCGPMLGFGLFNWMAPYSHDLTHGFTLALAGVLCLLKFIRQPRGWMLGLCGIFCGAAFLTKPEVFVSVMAAVIAGLGLAYLPKGRPTWKFLAMWAAGLALPIVIAVLLLMTKMSTETALQGVFRGWASLTDPRVTGLPFYQWLRGTDQPELRFKHTGLALAVTLMALIAAGATAYLLGPHLQNKRVRITAIVAAVLLAGVLFLGQFLTFSVVTPLNIRLLVLLCIMVADVAVFLRAQPESRPKLKVIIALTAVPAALLFLREFVEFTPILAALMVPIMEGVKPVWTTIHDGPVAQPFPFFVAALIALHLWRLIRPRTDLPRQQVVARLIVLIFALAMLAKIAFYVRFGHYSFVLNVAATLVLIAALLDWLPLVFKIPQTRAVFRGAMLALIVFTVAATCPINSTKQTEYRLGNEVFYAHPRFEAVKDAVKFLRTTPSASTVAVLPEGAMLNFLSRRVNPTPYVNTMPLEYQMYGERNVDKAFADHPPTYIVIVHRVTKEYGVTYFGKDYAPELMNWIRENYHSVALFGKPPLGPPPANIKPEDYFGVEIYQRNITEKAP